MAEFWRALRTLKALQAEAKSVEQPAASARALEASRMRSPLPLAAHAPNEPEGAALEAHVEYVLSERPPRGRTLHEPAAAWLPNEPVAPRRPNEPKPGRARQEARGRSAARPASA
jgi:hypothetical protein